MGLVLVKTLEYDKVGEVVTLLWRRRAAPRRRGYDGGHSPRWEHGKVMIVDHIFPELLASSHRESENTRCYRVVAKI